MSLGNFLIRTKYPFSTTFAAVSAVGVYPFLSVPNVLPTPSNLPQFFCGGNLQNFFTNIQISLIFKKLRMNFLIRQHCSACFSHAMLLCTSFLHNDYDVRIRCSFLTKKFARSHVVTFLISHSIIAQLTVLKSWSKNYL